MGRAAVSCWRLAVGNFSPGGQLVGETLQSNILPELVLY